MSRKQVGSIDADLLAEVDKRAEWLGQTRRTFIERALHKRLQGTDMKVEGQVVEAGEPVWVDWQNPRPGAVSSADAKRDVGPYDPFKKR